MCLSSSLLRLFYRYTGRKLQMKPDYKPVSIGNDDDEGEVTPKQQQEEQSRQGTRPTDCCVRAASLLAPVIALVVVCYATSHKFYHPLKRPQTDNVQDSIDSPVPLFLLGDDFLITHADERKSDQGRGPSGSVTYEITTSHQQQYELRWCVGDIQGWVYKHRDKKASVLNLMIVDQQYNASAVNDGFSWAARWTHYDECTFEIRATSTKIRMDEFQSILLLLRRPKDMQEWLSYTTPSRVVARAESAAVIQDMIQDIPIPPHFDTLLLTMHDARFREYYQLGAFITASIGCSWVQIWLDANHRQNDNLAVADMESAIEALKSCQHWKVFKQMKEEGAWPRVFCGYVRDLENDNYESLDDVKAQWGTGLGCARTLPSW